MLFFDDIVLETETSEEDNAKLEEWMTVLEGKRLRISRKKNKYLWFNFNGTEQVWNPVNH